MFPLRYTSKFSFMYWVASRSTTFLNGLLKETSTGWTRLVQPPGTYVMVVRHLVSRTFWMASVFCAWCTSKNRCISCGSYVSSVLTQCKTLFEFKEIFCSLIQVLAILMIIFHNFQLLFPGIALPLNAGVFPFVCSAIISYI